MKRYFSGSPLTVIIALLTGAILGAGGVHWSRRQASKPLPALSEGVPAQPSRTVASTPSDNDRAGEALRRRIADLERQLAYFQTLPPMEARSHSENSGTGSVTDSLASPTPQPPANEEPPREPRRRESYAERMERMRTEDPERYETLVKRREDFRQRMEERAQARNEFLAAIDTRGMNEDQYARHQQLLNTIEEVNAIMGPANPGQWRDMTGEQREEMGEKIRTLAELYRQEQRYLLEETGRALGEDGTAFADYIEYIQENTSMFPGMGRGGRGGGRGRQGQ